MESIAPAGPTYTTVPCLTQKSLSCSCRYCCLGLCANVSLVALVALADLGVLAVLRTGGGYYDGDCRCSCR